MVLPLLCGGRKRQPGTDSLFHRAQAWGGGRADLAGHQP